MFEWVSGHPAVLARAADVRAWRAAAGIATAEPIGPRSVNGVSALVLGGAPLTTAVPLELGGLLLVGAVYCDSDDALASHLDMMPTVGWELRASRFVSDGSGHVLFDGARTGAELEAGAEGGLVPVALEPGSYEVEVLGPWSPDERTEIWLTRLVRSAP